MSPPPLTPALEAGTTLAERFVILAPVGSGGMAVVYKARDLTTQSAVAVKLLHEGTKSSFVLDHFLHEAEILASLRHSHIVSYIAHGRTPDGQAYLAMEWLDGEDLEQRLRRGPLRLSEALRLVALTSAALAAAHAVGVVHRDLKPSNLFLRDNQIEALRLLDFGVARRLHAQSGHTRTGVVVGTPEYMAPEQVRADRNVGPAADIFALGCVLHECLSGRPPFSGEQVVAVLAKILFEDPPDVRKTRPGVPQELMEVLGRMLAKTAEEFCSAWHCCALSTVNRKSAQKLFVKFSQLFGPNADKWTTFGPRLGAIGISRRGSDETPLHRRFSRRVCRVVRQNAAAEGITRPRLIAARPRFAETLRRGEFF